MKDYVCFAIGAIGSMIAGLFGGWDASLQTLVIFMAIDYITGLIVAGVFHASPKTETGTLESRAGWKGLIRKGETLLIVLVACRLDAVMGSNFVRDAAVIAFVANETISIIENAGLMGLPIPAVIIKAVDILKQKQKAPQSRKDLTMSKYHISTATIARTAVLLLALTNQVLSALGKPVLPIESATVEQLVTAGITTVAALISWWKNNSFTPAAIAADQYLERQRKNVY